MAQIKWYKRDPSEALNGMMELTLEERGAYNTVLDLIYSRDGNLPDDDRFVAGWLRVDLRVWRRIKATLIERGKLYVEAGILRNKRADEVILTALSRVASTREAGKASARSKASKSAKNDNENNEVAATGVATAILTGVATNQNQSQILPTEVVAPKGACPSDDEHAFTVTDFVESWNETATACGLPKISKLTDARKRAFNVRRREYPEIEHWQAAFRCLTENKWMHGDNAKGWRADPDFFLQAKSFTKLVEGAYGKAE